jgi:hypothetical protein
MTHTVKPQRAYVTRRSDPDNARFVQREAEIIALQNGDTAEAARRRYAEQKLAAKARKRSEIKPLPAAIINALGKQDAISNMLKARYLEERHGRTTLHLRDYMLRREVTMGGGSNLVYVQGGVKSEMIDRIGALRIAAQAISAGELTLPSQNYLKPVTKLLCGHINITQAGRLVGGDTGKAQNAVKGALRRYLDAAEPFFGAGR